ncbi:jg15658 [Pararge aegeria aegeria]|uniref:Jg15658 protein n=1 Tax=Pararge aegeria aegeria TaxID=348720 RepID=A0A8S4RW67_9NEOP|nr:jg15658 [Pararge aegeria aegeria]
MLSYRYSEKRWLPVSEIWTDCCSTVIPPILGYQSFVGKSAGCTTGRTVTLTSNGQRRYRCERISPVIINPRAKRGDYWQNFLGSTKNNSPHFPVAPLFLALAAVMVTAGQGVSRISGSDSAANHDDAVLVDQPGGQMSSNESPGAVGYKRHRIVDFGTP